MSAKQTIQTQIPVLPLRDVVVFPFMVMPLFVGRDKSILSLEKAMESGKQLLLVAQKQAEQEDPGHDDIYSVGTLANIIQLLKLPDGTVKVLVEGQKRAKIVKFQDDGLMSAEIEVIESVLGDERELDVIKNSSLEEFDSYVQLNKKVQPEVVSALRSIADPER